MPGVLARVAAHAGYESSWHAAQVMPVAGLAAVVAGLALVVAEGPIHDSQLAQLLALPLVLIFGRGDGGLNDLVHESLGVVDFLRRVSSYKTMKRFLLVVSICNRSVSASMAARLARSAFLDRPFASDGDVGAGLVVHVGETPAPGSEDLADEVDTGKIFDRNVDLFSDQAILKTTKVTRCVVAWDSVHGGANERLSLLIQTLAEAMLARIDAAARKIVLRWWRGRSA